MPPPFLPLLLSLLALSSSTQSSSVATGHTTSQFPPSRASTALNAKRTPPRLRRARAAGHVVQPASHVPYRGAASTAFAFQPRAAFLDLGSRLHIHSPPPYGGSTRYAGTFMNQALQSMTGDLIAGRGRVRARTMVSSPYHDFDASYWSPPSVVGGDTFMSGITASVYPRHQYGYGGMPNGGFGTALHMWGGPSMQHARSAPWWRGRSFNSGSWSDGSPKKWAFQSHHPYGGVHERDNVAGHGVASTMSSPYWYVPPPLQADFRMPKDPPRPPPGPGAGAAASL